MIFRIFLFGISMLFFLSLEAEEKPYFSINFNNDFRAWKGRPGERGGNARSVIIKQGGWKKSPALLWEYEIGEQYKSCFYSCLVPNRVIPRKPTRMSVRICGDRSGTNLGVRLRDATGRIWQQHLTVIDFEGWKIIEIDIKPAGYAWGGKVRPDKGFTYPIRLHELMLEHKPDVKKGRSKGKIILDEFHFYERQLEEF